MSTSKFFQRLKLSYVKSFRDQTLYLSPGRDGSSSFFFEGGGDEGWHLYGFRGTEADRLPLTEF